MLRKGWLNRQVVVVAGLTALFAAPAQARDAAPDSATRDWWALTSELSSDAMEGRDTGSPGYDRAAALVAQHFAEAGLKPAGTDGTWFQSIPFEDLRLDSVRSRIALGPQRLRLNHDVMLLPASNTPGSLAATATFRGYCGPGDIGAVRGKLVVCYGRPAPAKLKGFDRIKALREAGAVGMLLIAAPGLPGEPFRWPFAYSRSVTPIGLAEPEQSPFLQGILNPASLPKKLRELVGFLERGSAGADMAYLELGRFSASLKIDRRMTRSANVLALLPGTDPALADQAIVVSAHLDGYGRGEPVAGDGIYNGALDDAAYVALLEQVALARAGQGFRRPLLFAVFTGEEKGLWGSRWFVKHPTVPLASIAANINLDQVRPLYPLKIMTVHGLKESTLGDLVRQVADARAITVQEDPEPERNLLRRSDNWPFMQAGIPGTSFVFATFDDPSRAAYRDWYQRRYHHPADDLSTPIDWAAARDFNAFFSALVQASADAPGRMDWHPGGKPAAD